MKQSMRKGFIFECGLVDLFSSKLKILAKFTNLSDTMETNPEENMI